MTEFNANETGNVLDQPSQMFIVVRNIKSQQLSQGNPAVNLIEKFKNEYRIKRGDVIKMGRLKFTVKDFRSDSHPALIDSQNGQKDMASPIKKTTNPNVFSTTRLGAANTKPVVKNSEIDEDEDEIAEEEMVEIECGIASADDAIQCKVCWSDEQTTANPLLSSCNCDGSVRFIHFDCLKHWLKQKMSLKEGVNSVSYTWKQFECEICKKPYPYVFRSQGMKFRLVDVDLPGDGNFLWLESLTFEKNSSRIVHVIKPVSAGKEG